MKKITTILIVTLLLLVAGCASSGRKMDMSKMQDIRKGETTRAELTQWFGSPQYVGLDAEGRSTAQWMYVHVANQGQNFIPVVGAFTMGFDQQMQQLIVTFDENNVVHNFTFNQSDTETGANLKAEKPAAKVK